jgi:hypothetical protein
VDNDQRLLNVQYAVYATGAPIIEEEKIDESQLQLPSFDVNLDPVMGVGPAVQIELQPPVSDSTSAQNSSSDAFVPPSIESSALPSGNHESASDAASASLSVARKIGYVPLVSALLPYRPLFCSIGFLNRVINSKLYRYGILAWGVLLVTAYGFQNSPIGPQNWYTFVPLVVITSGFIAFEIARVDRFLLYHLMRQFDFWFLVISLLGYIISEVYSQMSQPERCYNIQRGLAHTFEVFSSNFLFFWVYLSTFVFDAAVFVSNSTRIGMLILTLANTARLIIFDRLEGLYAQLVIFCFSICQNLIDMFCCQHVAILPNRHLVSGSNFDRYSNSLLGLSGHIFGSYTVLVIAPVDSNQCDLCDSGLPMSIRVPPNRRALCVLVADHTYQDYICQSTSAAARTSVSANLISNVFKGFMCI